MTPNSVDQPGTSRNSTVIEILNKALTYARSLKMTGRVQVLPVYESGVTFLNLYEKSCRLLSQGVIALVAPSVPSMAPLVAAIGTKYGILTILPASLASDPTMASSEAIFAGRASSPLLPPPPINKPQISPRRPPLPTPPPATMLSDSTSVVVRPRQDFLATAIEDYLVKEKWDSFTIIYEDPNGNLLLFESLF